MIEANTRSGFVRVFFVVTLITIAAGFGYRYGRDHSPLRPTTMSATDMPAPTTQVAERQVLYW